MVRRVSACQRRKSPRTARMLWYGLSGGYRPAGMGAATSFGGVWFFLCRLSYWRRQQCEAWFVLTLIRNTDEDRFMIFDDLLVPSKEIIKGLTHNFRLADFGYSADFSQRLSGNFPAPLFSFQAAFWR